MDNQCMTKITPGEKKLVDLYKKIDFEHNLICKKCRDHNPNLSNPIGAWVVGNEFYTHQNRILFIGKNARGNPGEYYSGYQFVFEAARDYLWDKSWPYWRYTREIVQTIYGNDSIENIAFTNLVKCNDSENVDTTSSETKQHCICELRAVSNEIEIINPTHIVLYTSWWYDDLFENIFETFRIVDQEEKDIGKKKMPWLEAEGTLSGKTIKILRVGHPERMKKEDYVSSICDWIKVTSI